MFRIRIAINIAWTTGTTTTTAHCIWNISLIQCSCTTICSWIRSTNWWWYWFIIIIIAFGDNHSVTIFRFGFYIRNRNLDQEKKIETELDCKYGSKSEKKIVKIIKEKKTAVVAKKMENDFQSCSLMMIIVYLFFFRKTRVHMNMNSILIIIMITVNKYYYSI